MQMPGLFQPVAPVGSLHDRVTQLLGLKVIEADRARRSLSFPNEADLCQQLGVSRTVVRESMKVLADKGMLAMKPRAGTWALPRSEWRLLDDDILRWQAERDPEPRFLRDLCEVRLAIEPTAAGFAAVRATPDDLAAIARCLADREATAATPNLEQVIDLDLEFHSAVVKASQNPLLEQLSNTIRRPFRTALSYTTRFPAAVALSLDAHRSLLDALRRHDPLAANTAAGQIVGLAMLAVEQVIASHSTKSKGHDQ